MSTDFIKKKLFSVAAKTAAVVFILCALSYAVFLKRVEYFPMEKSFYFLVDTSTHLEACVATATLQGGAGYVVADDTREYAALSVYSSINAGNAAKKGRNEQDYSLLEKRVEALYFKTRAEKRKKSVIVSAFQCLDDCIEVLNVETERLQESATQQSTKRVLNELSKQFSYLGNCYERDFPSYAQVCIQAEQDLKERMIGVVYARELRYICCWLCDSFVELSEEYAL